MRLTRYEKYPTACQVKYLFVPVVVTTFDQLPPLGNSCNVYVLELGLDQVTVKLPVFGSGLSAMFAKNAWAGKTPTAKNATAAKTENLVKR